MSKVLNLKKESLKIAVKKAFCNWSYRFKEDFGSATTLALISNETLAFLAQGRDKGAFYLYDLIMNLVGFGSAFEFNELVPKKKMIIIDRYLFFLDQIRFECMKRLGWLANYPGESIPLVDLVLEFDRLAPGIQAVIPVLSPECKDYDIFCALVPIEREVFIRKLIPRAITEIEAMNSCETPDS